MNKEEMQSMMPEMMEKMFSGMTTDDKKEMMMGMMSAKEGEGGMKDMMAKMIHGDEGKESMMPEMMFKGMMPHCIKMMMPAISKEKRADLVSNMVSTLMEQASSGMSDAEKSSFVAKVIDSIKT